jgi:hypothetical protein
MLSPLPLSRWRAGRFAFRIRRSTIPEIFTYHEAVTTDLYHQPYRTALALWPRLLWRLLTNTRGKGTALVTGLLRGCLDAMHLPMHEGVLHPERNPRIPMTLSHSQAREPIYSTSVGRWHHYDWLFGDEWEQLASLACGSPHCCCCWHSHYLLGLALLASLQLLLALTSWWALPGWLPCCFCIPSRQLMCLALLPSLWLLHLPYLPRVGGPGLAGLLAVAAGTPNAGEPGLPFSLPLLLALPLAGGPGLVGHPADVATSTGYSYWAWPCWPPCCSCHFRWL